MDALDFERDFEAKKRQISSNMRGSIRLQLPQRLKQFANTEVLDQHTRTLTFAHMYVQNEQFKSFFMVAKNKIIGILKDILVELDSLVELDR